MPRREFKSVPEERRTEVLKAVRTSYKEEPGYEWSKTHFGPSPGIPRKTKERLDKLVDGEFKNALLKLQPDQRRCLMVSEEQRRRSFRNTWNHGKKVKGTQLAAAGFYHLYDGDKVKCAFCDGVLSNWIAGDSPMAKHKQKFSFCRLVKGTAKENIPFEETGFGHLILMKKRDPKEDARSGAATSEAKKQAGHEEKVATPEYSKHSARYDSFKHPNLPPSLRKHPKLIEELCDAGFYYYGDGDRCKCFMCNGTVEDWAEYDDPWKEHAKWYYRCNYLLTSKGGDYIRKVRGGMTEQERLESESLRYDLGTRDLDDLKIAEEEIERRKQARTFEAYKFAYEQLGISDEILMKAYKDVQYVDTVDTYQLIRLVHNEQDKQEGELPKNIELGKSERNESTINEIIKQGEEPSKASRSELSRN